MRDNFERSLALLWARTGDAVHPGKRKGQDSKYGLTRKTLAAWRATTQADVDMEELQKGEAGAILHVWFWRGVWADELPAGLDHAVFCHAVSVGVGPKRAISALQFALRVRPDGEMTARVIRAAERCDIAETMKDFQHSMSIRMGGDASRQVEAEALRLQQGAQ